tara:strand:+ start:10786 stop:11607 length:822 start_codon:yes stop_codon:yes gene_type:complete
MADKGFGVKELNLIGDSGTPTILSPNNLNLNAVNVAISTDVSIGGTCTATEFSGAISGWIIGNDGSSHYTFTGPGLTGTVDDPNLNLVRGQKYIFHNRSSGHPFRIQSTPNGSAGTAYNTGVTNNDGSAPTDIIFDVPQDAPDTLYYQCTAHPNMGGKLIIEKEHSHTPEINSQTTSYTVQKSDVGKIIEIASNVNLSVNLTNKSTSGWVNGDSFQILTNSSQSTTLNAVGLSLYWANGSSYSTGARTLNAYSLVTLTYFDNDKWFLTGNGIQ